MNNWQLKDFETLCKLGHGNFGDVYKIKHKSSGAEFAMKIVSMDRTTQQSLLTEVEIMETIRHTNIVSLLTKFSNASKILMVMELCNGGNLDTYIKNKPAKRLGERESMSFMMQMINGLSFLHSRDYIHRDLKPMNILLSFISDCLDESTKIVLKLGDFGFSRHLSGTALAKTCCGSPIYMPPEVLSNRQYNHSADIWSLGCIYHEMLTGRNPYVGGISNQYDLLQKIINIPTPEINIAYGVSDETKIIILRMLDKVPSQRPAANDLREEIGELYAHQARAQHIDRNMAVLSPLPSPRTEVSLQPEKNVVSIPAIIPTSQHNSPNSHPQPQHPFRTANIRQQMQQTKLPTLVSVSSQRSARTVFTGLFGAVQYVSAALFPTLVPSPVLVSPIQSSSVKRLTGPESVTLQSSTESSMQSSDPSWCSSNSSQSSGAVMLSSEQVTSIASAEEHHIATEECADGNGLIKTDMDVSNSAKVELIASTDALTSNAVQDSAVDTAVVVNNDQQANNLPYLLHSISENDMTAVTLSTPCAQDAVVMSSSTTSVGNNNTKKSIIALSEYVSAARVLVSFADTVQNISCITSYSGDSRSNAGYELDHSVVKTAVLEALSVYLFVLSALSEVVQNILNTTHRTNATDAKAANKGIGEIADAGVCVVVPDTTAATIVDEQRDAFKATSELFDGLIARTVECYSEYKQMNTTVLAVNTSTAIKVPSAVNVIRKGCVGISKENNDKTTTEALHKYMNVDTALEIILNKGVVVVV